MAQKISSSTKPGERAAQVLARGRQARARDAASIQRQISAAYQRGVKPQEGLRLLRTCLERALRDYPPHEALRVAQSAALAACHSGKVSFLPHYRDGVDRSPDQCVAQFAKALAADPTVPPFEALTDIAAVVGAYYPRAELLELDRRVEQTLVAECQGAASEGLSFIAQDSAFRREDLAGWTVDAVGYQGLPFYEALGALYVSAGRPESRDREAVAGEVIRAMAEALHALKKDGPLDASAIEEHLDELDALSKLPNRAEALEMLAERVSTVARLNGPAD